ncbi:toprim domain-containing protein [Sulfoacidibacillus thermotolerans]|uniref:Toprim domain-containing protein n=1 Tax=Sulfoacidibacillus thermotolerans TaxID=1765684 RepID=A0A2U3D6Z2_SULT2|nr:toprim domain-containing protein [Sulfoacidibacillus thermotolerans]PWI57047.1 hypothetical protein BM613_10345 [Sulfoacidibacillus thermotolerans]
MHSVIIVEGKHDKERLSPLVNAETVILCTYGIPTHDHLMELKTTIGDAQVYIFTDHDRAGRRIRGILNEEFPDAVHLHTKAEYGGVENTPLVYLTHILERYELLAETNERHM